MAHSFEVVARGARGWTTRVAVGVGVLRSATASIAATYPSHRRVVISDARVGRLHGRDFVASLGSRRAPAVLLTFPAGERHKTRETKARLEDSLLRLGAGRDTVVIALGGGVTGDLAGFVAATWHRGVPVVQIPTTLLAMVDASLGGKTGVDLPGGKNLVGAFHQPDSLWADVRLLHTLPRRTFRAGLAEAVKTAVVADAALFGAIERDAARLAAREDAAVSRLVARCLALKGRIVVADPRDGGRRAVLNFGHTVAHAIEAASGYRVPHGEAVAIGLVVEARAAEDITGFPRAQADRLEALLKVLGLPVRPPAGLDPRALVEAMARDKKTRGGVVRCALPVAIGRMLRAADPTVPVASGREFLPLLGGN